MRKILIPLIVFALLATTALSEEEQTLQASSDKLNSPNQVNLQASTDKLNAPAPASLQVSQSQARLNAARMNTMINLKANAIVTAKLNAATQAAKLSVPGAKLKGVQTKASLKGGYGYNYGYDDSYGYDTYCDPYDPYCDSYEIYCDPYDPYCDSYEQSYYRRR